VILSSLSMGIWRLEKDQNWHMHGVISTISPYARLTPSFARIAISVSRYSAART
jgi:hypothetical protein